MNPTAELADWRRVRRYAVPRWMIERATERRLAGDWRGACEVAGFDVAFDLDEVARDHGAAIAEELADDLAHLVPDLVRWHLPRVGGGRTTIATRKTIVLVDHRDHALHLEAQRLVDGPQRPRLVYGAVPEPVSGWPEPERQDWTGSRYLWDARRTGELLERCGGEERPPFFHRDGTPLTRDELPDSDPWPFDPTARTEWITLLQEAGRMDDALTALGIELAPEVEAGQPHFASSVARIDPVAVLERLPLAPSRLLPEIVRHGRALSPCRINVDRLTTILLSEPERTASGERGPLQARAGFVAHRDAPVLPEACWRRLPDLDLLRAGLIGPDALHPLVRSALFPERPVTGPAGPPGPPRPLPARVRCRGEWHEVRMRDGVLRGPHSPEEHEREQAMRVLGGEVAGCFAARQAWTGAGGRLPRALRDQRADLFLRVQHCDTPGVLALLDAGVDPHARDGRRQTLLHHLHKVDHGELLPRLLEAGLDLEARDHHDRTPLHVVVAEHGSADLIRALLEAGARTGVVDDRGQSLRQAVHARDRHSGRSEVAFLLELLGTEPIPGETVRYGPDGTPF
jgi:hypothetical protein